MKPFSRDYIYSWYNAKEAEDYVGMDGYFGNSLDELIDDISYHSPSGLLKVHRGDPVDKVFVDTNRNEFGLFVPLALLGEDDE